MIQLALSQHVRDSQSQVAVPQLAFISRDVSASSGVAAETASPRLAPRSHVFEGNNLQHSKRIRLPAISQDVIAELALPLLLVCPTERCHTAWRFSRPTHPHLQSCTGCTLLVRALLYPVRMCTRMLRVTSCVSCRAPLSGSGSHPPSPRPKSTSASPVSGSMPVVCRARARHMSRDCADCVGKCTTALGRTVRGLQKDQTRSKRRVVHGEPYRI